MMQARGEEFENQLQSHHEQIGPSNNISCDICEMIFKTEVVECMIMVRRALFILVTNKATKDKIWKV